MFRDTPLALPADDPGCVRGEAGRDKLCRRQAARTTLGQVFRLTETLLDLSFADEAIGRSSEELAARFLDWLTSSDCGATQVRNDCEQWLKHLRLIVDSCLDGAGRPWHELVHAQEESWTQLFELAPVVGVTGGSGGHRRAVRQFRTPSLPRVIVCTDTLKEGVDLHLFCDQVLHYGVAWTSGDLEQRVGRVDRYFSQIERRLSGEGRPPDVSLHVGYPHVVASLERGQVERVIQRQRDVEALMDSPLAGTGDEEREHGVDAQARAPNAGPARQPYGELSFPTRRRSIAAVSVDAALADKEHYLAWYGALGRRLEERGWSIGGDGSMSGDTVLPVRQATLTFSGDRQHEIEWSFDAALRRYVITLASPPWPSDTMFSGGERRRIVGRERRHQSFVRLLVPTPDEGTDENVIVGLINALDGVAPKPNASAHATWGEAFGALSPDGVDWESSHKARLLIRRGERAQRVAVYAYEGSVRVVSVVSATLDRLGRRTGWDEPPSADDVREWILDANSELPLGYLDLHGRDGLVFGIHVLHGDLSADARRRLVEEVGWRADCWEASLTGVDRE
ncbi:MAG: helicase-related protein [Gemmatimonadota bacterium]|nr:helicase-related protein [Gemmatimonadota bacterium]